MGTKIVDSIIDFSGNLNNLCTLMNKISTLPLEQDLCRRVWKIFRSMMPLRTTSTDVPVSDMFSVYVGEWIRRKYYWHKFGVPLSETDLLTFLKFYGDKIVPVVRPKIRDVFAQCVSLTSEILDYKVKKEIDLDAVPIKTVNMDLLSLRVEVSQIPVYKIILSSSDPWSIVLVKGENSQVDVELRDKKNWDVVEQVYDRVVELYLMVYEELKARVDHNMNVIRRMEEAAAPFVVASTLKRGGV